MNKHITSLILSVAIYCCNAALADEVWVHFAGQVKKAGTYKVTTPATVEDLEKASGGWTEFGSAKRLTIIRLERPSNATTGDPGEAESKVFKFADIPRKDGKLILKQGDLVFLPEKQVIGR